MDVLIVGAGIVGSSLAKHLAQLGAQVTLVDRSLATPLPGSTGHAPGFVGQLNEIPALTELAKRSVKEYLTIEGGFDAVGGLEIAESAAGQALVESRLSLAQSFSLPARKVTAEEAAKMAPDFVDEPKALSGLFYESDGTARAQHIALSDRRQAQKFGAKLVEADVLSFIRKEDRTVGVKTSSGILKASQVVIASGIWARQLLDLHVYPVAHPYTHSQSHPPRQPSPFVRWPEAHVYARDHGDYDGIGSYDHAAIAVKPADLSHEAYGTWEASFDQVLEKAKSHLPSTTSFIDDKPFNGLFAMTPDNLPLVGAVDEGLCCAVAVWVTHAAGCAELLARKIMGEKLIEVDQELLRALEPSRFRDQDAKALKAKSLKAYNDIYNTD